MKKYGKIAALIAGVALVVGFASCSSDVEYKDRIVEKTVEKLVPADTTTEDAVAVYHYKASTGGGYTLYPYASDGVNFVVADAYKEQYGDKNKSVYIVSGNETTSEKEIDVKEVPAGTKLSDIAKNLPGFYASTVTTSKLADGTVAANVYYDRNYVTITADADGKTYTASGLFGQNTALQAEIQKELTSGKFIASTTIPEYYPAENASYTVTLETANVAESDGFIKVPNGSFKRAASASATAYTITLSKDLYVCGHEVTQGEWEEYMTYYGEVTSNDSYRPVESYGKGENYPVYRVNWYEAVIYCNLLSMANNLTPAYYITIGEGEGSKKINPEDWLNTETFASNIKKTDDGKFYYDGTSSNSKLDYKGESDTDGGIRLDKDANGYRLPTEAEWEYAALGSYKDNENWNGYGDSSNTSGYVFAGYDGRNADSVGKYAWYSSNSSNKTHEVKGKLPNSYGLYDMSGNVWEWCSDWYNDYSSSDENDPAGSASGDYRVGRGGSWGSVASRCDVSRRNSYDPDIRDISVGFRLVRNAN